MEKAGAIHPILLIDGDCVLCNRVARFVIARDPEALFRFAALGSEVAGQILGARGLPPPPPGTFVLIRGERAFYRSDAALRVLGMMRAPWRWCRVGLWIPRFVRDFGYNLVARTRIRLFGRTQSCGLLGPDERSRFLEGGLDAEQ